MQFIENACGGITGRSPRILAFVKVLWESESVCVESAPAVPGACGIIFGSAVKDGFVGRFYNLLVASFGPNPVALKAERRRWTLAFTHCTSCGLRRGLLGFPGTERRGGKPVRGAGRPLHSGAGLQRARCRDRHAHVRVQLRLRTWLGPTRATHSILTSLIQ